MPETFYPDLYEALVNKAKQQGFKVVVVGRRVLHDYAAMNPEAAKLIGKPQPKNEIEIEAGVPFKTKYEDLNHEMIERALMAKGWKYWPAHLYALKHQSDITPETFHAAFASREEPPPNDYTVRRSTSRTPHKRTTARAMRVH